MTDTRQPTDAAADVTRARRLDQVCDWFEEHRRGGGTDGVGGFLESVVVEDRASLFGLLLEVECELAARTGRVVPIDELQIYFNAADVAVFAYRDALTSGALINALGFAKPVIASRVGCIPELLNTPEIGVLVPPGDVAALTDAMRAARDWDLASRGAAAQTRARELDWDQIALQTLAAYGRKPRP